MKRKTREQLEHELTQTTDLLRSSERTIKELKDRMALIAGENETLRLDKKWFQQMYSGHVQSIAKISETLFRRS